MTVFKKDKLLHKISIQEIWMADSVKEGLILLPWILKITQKLLTLLRTNSNNYYKIASHACTLLLLKWKEKRKHWENENVGSTGKDGLSKKSKDFSKRSNPA